ncbi:MAG: class I SAM-dependent methyltransferase [Candidatus Muirbacterium halophilum]|nr:class I SAM-dependent methyltransferase [Candidatus Muirbacterium halophilum]MCK9477852.1 class I SAM-dependent methyltransferase [Candidatus Muirbacterium halophilum]
MINSLLENRFTKKEKKNRAIVWNILIKFFQKYIDINSTVLDIGSGFGEFINNIKAKKKIALDICDMKKFYKNDVDFFQTDMTDLSFIEDESIDCVFASNFFEHINTKIKFQKIFNEISKKIKKNGIIIIMQPDFELSYKHYFKFYDHNIIFTLESMAEVLKFFNFNIELKIKRFMPFSFKQYFPINRLFVIIYMKFYFLRYFFGKQFLLIGRK